MTAISNSKNLPNNEMVSIMGPPGVGKTWAAASASEHWTGEPAELNDMLWILADVGGLDGLREAKIYVPVIDVSRMTGREWLDGFKTAKAEIKKRVKEGLTKTIVVDTVTSLDKVLLAHHLQRFEKFALYNAQFKEHMDLFHFLKSLPCNVVSLFHQKYKMDLDDEGQRKAAQASGQEVGGISIDITGQSSSLYRGNGNLRLVMKRKRLPGNKVGYFLCKEAANSDSRSRYACLEPEEPAHLGDIFTKIRAATGVSDSE